MKLTEYFKPITLILAAVFSLVFVGCEKDTQLISPGEESAAEQATAVTADGKTIHFLGFQEAGRQTLEKVVTSSKYINKTQGGTVSLTTSNQGLVAQYTLSIPPQSMDSHNTISMTFDDSNFQGFADVVFGPHGTQFSTPALLDVNLEGLDLSGVNPNKVDFYYVNDNGQWQKMVFSSIVVDKSLGKVVIDDAKINHFSRYALATE